MSKGNILTRIGITIEHFSESERKAQAQAAAITTKAKALLSNPLTLTVEAVFPEAAAAAPAVTAIVDRLCKTLANPVVSNDLDLVAATLGRYGALLTAELDSHAHKTIGDYVVIFESLFNA